MQAIDKALKDLASQESPNYGATVRKYGIDRCLIIIPVILTVFTRLVHQLRVYAFGAPTTRLRV